MANNSDSNKTPDSAVGGKTFTNEELSRQAPWKDGQGPAWREMEKVSMPATSKITTNKY